MKIRLFFSIFLLSTVIFAQENPKKIQIDPQMQVTLGGWESPGELKDNLPRMQENGITSHEIYVPWAKIEKEKGKYDFTNFDPLVEQYKKSGMKWVPFLILGPAYSLPSWYYNSDEHVGYVCLEHNKECDVQSLWSPGLENHADDFIHAFADHYKDTGSFESLLLGITGNYGEAIYPASENDWTADTHGKYHTHSGFWCGDKYAIVDFQKYLKKKYGNVSRLNKKWDSTYITFGEISTHLQKDWKSDWAWLDQMEWYRASILKWADVWLKITRKYFPNTRIYLCTGGVDLQNWLGADFSAQAKLVKKYNAGIRITNEASDYSYNFTLTRMVSSACKFYKTFYGFEPAGNVTEQGVVARIYNDTASGAIQMHFYSDNIFGSSEKLANWRKSAPYLKYRNPQVDVAVLYPKIFSALAHNEFIERDKQLRDVIDHDYVDENMIQDGALKQYKFLVIVDGNIWPEETWQKIVQWVRGGGILLAPEHVGTLLDIDRHDKFDKILFPEATNSIGKGKTFRFLNSIGDHKTFCSLVGKITDIKSNPKKGIYITQFKDKSQLIYDSNNSIIEEIPYSIK